MTTHLSEEEMILHFYGEPGNAGAAQHLSECAECQARFADLRALLNSVDGLRVPERGDNYGAEVWAKVQPKLRGQVIRMRPRWHVWAAAVAAMLFVGVSGYVIGVRDRRPAPQAAMADASARVLLVALTEHLERSQMVMTELSNASTPDFGYERGEAEDLLESNRLYRQSAAQHGDTQTVVLLEDLERLLTEIAHSSDKMGPAELEEFRRKIEEEAFKVKVLSTRLERQANEKEKRGSNNKL